MSISNRKNRWLTQTLVLSALLNGALVAIFFYFFISKTSLPTHFDFFPIASSHEFTPQAKQLLSALSTQKFQELLPKLTSKRSIEHGYLERDLALAIITERDHFDLKRALGKPSLSQRKLILDPQHSLILFPGLADKQYQKIADFLQNEKWPFSPRGLFLQMQTTQDLSLFQTFSQTPEFHQIHLLFARTDLPITKRVLLKMLIEGSWETLSRHLATQKQGSDFSETNRRELLQHYIAAGSKTAAYLLLITDPDYAIHQLDDSTVCEIIALIPEKTQEAVLFVQALLDSSRGEPVHRHALAQLGQYSGRGLTPRPAEGELRPAFRERPPASPDPRLHIIQPGESLWLLSSKYNISIEDLMLHNHLQTTVLQPGKTLKIP